jgi:hypothetical protein
MARMTKFTTGYAAILAVTLATVPAAFAQTPDSKGCTQQERENQTMQDSGRTAGVICPPDIDPAMKAPTPKAGDKSVIPAPGTSGGNTNVQPK